MLLHLCGERLRRGRSHVAIDVEAVGIDAEREDLGAKLLQGHRRRFVGGTVGAIHHHPQALEAHLPGERALGRLDIALKGSVDALGAPELVRLGKTRSHIGIDQSLDLLLRRIGQFEAVRPEQLNAVVVIGIVGCGDHHAVIGAERAGQHGDGRGRHGSEQEDIDADRDKTRGDGVLDHIAGEPRILADDDPLSVAVAVVQADGHADTHRNVGRHRMHVRLATDTVRAEILPRQSLPQIPPGAPMAATVARYCPPIDSKQ